MPKKSAYRRTLADLTKLLKRKPCTAREIAAAMNCCRLAAYQRIDALRERGAAIYTLPAARIEGVTGPSATAYGIR